MSPLAFDTLEYVHKLKEAGISEKQAETHAQALTLIIDNNLAAKHDLKELENTLKLDIELIRRDMKEIESNLKRDMKEIESNLKRDMKEIELKFDGQFTLLRWMMGFILAGTLSLILKAYL